MIPKFSHTVGRTTSPSRVPYTPARSAARGVEEERIDISLGEELLLSAVDVNGLLPFVRFVEGEAQQA